MGSTKTDFSSMAASSLPNLDVGWNSGSMGIHNSSSLFSSSSINMMHISQLSHSLEQKPRQKKDSIESLEDMLERRQREILEKVVQNERDLSRERMEKLEEERLLQDWEEEKKLFLIELAGGRVLGGSSQPLATLASLPTTINTLSVSTVPALDLKTIAQSHVDLVSRWNREPEINEKEEFARIATPTKSPSYAVAWRLLAASDGRPNPPSVATGGLAQLSRQFQFLIINRVQKASLAGQDVSLSMSFSNGMATTVATFVKLEHGSNSSVWHTIFYCLRCGDASAAINVIDSAAIQIDTSIRHVVATMAQLQGSSSCVWDVSMPRIDRREILESKPRCTDTYEEACWILLSLSEVMSGTVVKTIEDHLFGNLWYAVQQPNATDLLKDFGKSIVALGPNYFEETVDSNGWLYALPLLVTQQYRTALTHLVRVGGPLGLLQATHLGMVMGEIQDLGSVVVGEQPMLTTLLIEFSQQLQIADAAAALEYLVRIPNPDRKSSEVARLIVETRQFETLAGNLSTDGVRQGSGSALNQHFVNADVSVILEDAAQLANSKKNSRDAMELLSLAERYDTLLELLNQELVTQINQAPASQERQSWKVTAQQFHAWHLEGQRTHVVDVLTKRHKLSLVQTSRTILKLFDFYDALTMQDFQRASAIVEEFAVLPITMADLQAKETKFRSLDPLLKEIFPDVFLGAMKALYNQHEILKHSGILTNKSTVMQRLLELRNRSSALMSFAGRLNLKDSSEQLAVMNRMEAAMV